MILKICVLSFKRPEIGMLPQRSNNVRPEQFYKTVRFRSIDQHDGIVSTAPQAMGIPDGSTNAVEVAGMYRERNSQRTIYDVYSGCFHFLPVPLQPSSANELHRSTTI